MFGGELCSLTSVSSVCQQLFRSFFNYQTNQLRTVPSNFGLDLAFVIVSSSHYRVIVGISIGFFAVLN